MSNPKFGWLSPAASHAGSDFKPITMYQAEHIFPSVLPHFDSVWVADHFYGFDAAKKEGFLEAWTTLTWLAAKFDNVDVAHHVLGHGYRNPALTAKMASSLQVLSCGRFILGIGGAWREEEFKAYGYAFPPPSVRLHQLEEVVQICRKMWTEEHPSFVGEYFSIEVRWRRPDPTSCRGSASEFRRDHRIADRGPTRRHVEHLLRGRRLLEAQTRHRRRSGHGVRPEQR